MRWLIAVAALLAGCAKAPEPAPVAVVQPVVVQPPPPVSAPLPVAKPVAPLAPPPVVVTMPSRRASAPKAAPPIAQLLGCSAFTKAACGASRGCAWIKGATVAGKRIRGACVRAKAR